METTAEKHYTTLVAINLVLAMKNTLNLLVIFQKVRQHQRLISLYPLKTDYLCLEAFLTCPST